MNIQTKSDFPSESSYSHAAWLLGININVIKSFAAIEAGPYGAFLDSGEPVILYERHIFHRLTNGKYDKKFIEIEDSKGKKQIYFLSSPSPGGYGPVSVQHAKLQAAVLLDRDAALKSCSWGLFQLMGENYALCGYQNIQRFVTAMYRSVDDHLKAFVQYVRHNNEIVNDKMLIDALRESPPDYLTSALIYNGRRQKSYDIKFRKEFERLEGLPS